MNGGVVSGGGVGYEWWCGHGAGGGASGRPGVTIAFLDLMN